MVVIIIIYLSRLVVMYLIYLLTERSEFYALTSLDDVANSPSICDTVILEPLFQFYWKRVSEIWRLLFGTIWRWVRPKIIKKKNIACQKEFKFRICMTYVSNTTTQHLKAESIHSSKTDECLTLNVSFCVKISSNRITISVHIWN